MAVGNPYGSFENFIKVWDKKITSTILGFHLKNDTEDVKSQLYLDLFEKKYLDRFDSEKSTIATWVYGFVKNYLRKCYNSGKRDLIYNGVSIGDNFDENEVGSMLFLNVFVVDSHEEKCDLEITIASILEILDRPQYAAYSKAPDGTNRDMATVARMFLSGYTPKEISEKFDTSVQFIYKLLKKIGSIEEVRQLVSEA